MSRFDLLSDDELLEAFRELRRDIVVVTRLMRERALAKTPGAA